MADAPIRFGVNYLPNAAEDTLRWAQVAEEVGFDIVGIADSQSLYRDVYMCLALCAAETSRVGRSQFGVGCVDEILHGSVLSEHDPFKPQARQARGQFPARSEGFPHFPAVPCCQVDAGFVPGIADIDPAIGGELDRLDGHVGSPMDQSRSS